MCILWVPFRCLKFKAVKILWSFNLISRRGSVNGESCKVSVANDANHQNDQLVLIEKEGHLVVTSNSSFVVASGVLKCC